MKIWKLVSGIISIVLFFIVAFQSCVAGVANAFDDITKDTSDIGGIIVAIILLVAGITTVCVWKTNSRGTDVALIILYGIAAFVGFSNLAHLVT